MEGEDEKDVTDERGSLHQQPHDVCVMDFETSLHQKPRDECIGEDPESIDSRVV